MTDVEESTPTPHYLAITLFWILTALLTNNVAKLIHKSSMNKVSSHQTLAAFPTLVHVPRNVHTYVTYFEAICHECSSC